MRQKINVVYNYSLELLKKLDSFFLKEESVVDYKLF